MIFNTEWLTPTRASGMLSYGVAAACCGLTWVRANNRRLTSRLAGCLTIIETALFFDIVFNWRWTLHQFLMDQAARWDLYATRRGPQAVVLVIFAVLVFLGIFLVLRFAHTRIGAMLAVLGVLLSVALWCTEVVSLHAVDHVLYRLLGKLMFVSFVWGLAALLTSIGILLESRRQVS